MSAPLVCVGDVWVLPMRTVGTRGQGGKSPPFRQGYKQNVDLLKALNCPIPQIFRPSYGPSHDSVLFLENYCGALLIIYLPWWFPINYQVANSRIARHRRGTPWARAANFVKIPLLIVNVTNLELNGFNASMWVSWSPTDPKKLQCIDQCIQTHQICVNKHRWDINIKFDVSLHFWPIWPTVRHSKFRTHFRSEVLCNLKFNMITEFTDNDQVWHMITSWDHHRVIYADFLQWHCFDFRVLDHIFLKL
jgi:hypothetical protein